jgi:hypothetical protein
VSKSSQQTPQTRKRRASPGGPANQPQRPSTNAGRRDDDETGLANWFRGFVRTSPALAFSLLLHLVVILGLGIVTIATVQRKPELVLTATSVEGEAESVEEYSEIEIENIEELSMDATELDSPLPEMAEMEMTNVDLPTTTAESAVAAGATTGDASGEAVAGKPATKSKPDRPKTKSVVQFAGTAAAGNRFAFVVDNSPSMLKDGRMLATIDQLSIAIGQMTPKQEFFVVLYSDSAYPMFFPDSATEFVPATKSNKSKLGAWLRTIEINYGGKGLIEASELVFELNPDVVFLLGDGVNYSEKSLDALVGFNPKRKCVVNTIAVGAGPKGAETLYGIAQANRGQFKNYPIAPAFAQMSQRVPFRYNKKTQPSWAKRLGK